MSPEQHDYRISLEEIISNAKEITLRDGNHVPLLIVEGSKNLVVGQIQDMLKTHGEKLELMRFLGQAAAKSGRVGKLQQVFLVSEGWMSVASEEKPAEMIPSQDPKRKEVLIISGIQMQEPEKQLRLFEMLRDSDERIIRLEELLPDAKKDGSVEIPLLDAFINGFQLAFRTRYN